jgi:phosphoserine phosphatase
MTENTAQSEQFTGLILLTGTDEAGFAASLFQTLAPFAVHVIDVEQIVINNRLILTVLIGANPAHQSAIELDLSTCASTLNVDIATLFGRSVISSIPPNLLVVHISASKLHPQSLALTTQMITNVGANIEKISRTSVNPVSIDITISGVPKKTIEAEIAALVFENDTTISVSDL